MPPPRIPPPVTEDRRAFLGLPPGAEQPWLQARPHESEDDDGRDDDERHEHRMGREQAACLVRGTAVRHGPRSEDRDADHHQHAHAGEEQRLDDWADVTPATDEPGMLRRKMPIIATVPACAWRHRVDCRSALDAPPGGLERQTGSRIRRVEDVPPGDSDQRRLGCLQRQGDEEPVDRDVADPSDDADDPAPKVSEHIRDERKDRFGEELG